MEENLGMVMVFTVISAAMEWLGSKWEEIKQRRQDIIKERKDREEAELQVCVIVCIFRRII
jgi:hypothetical protein